MIEIIIHGRGGAGGVTLAKLIAGAYFLRDKYVQAFGVYGAERSGAPVQAYVRVDDEEITRSGPVTAPDHVVIIDPSLISLEAASGMKAGGWVIINSQEEPSAFVAQFPGHRIASLDASEIALANHLGSAALPIVNTTMLGAIVRLLGLDFEDAEAALAAVKFGGPNLEAARTAYECVRVHDAEGSIAEFMPGRTEPSLGFVEEAAGSLPTTHTGEWASRRPSRRELDAVCNHACPAGNDVRGFLAAAARQDHTAALATILETSPFPGICGRVCPAPCVSACNRTALDEAVNVREVERAIAERGAWPEAVWPRRPEKVAVVGSGPAGLSAAYHLARAGFSVTVFEASSESGGVMRHGIPSYRLPREVLDREVDYVVSQGVCIMTEHPIDREELRNLSRKFTAVVLATGLGHLLDLDLGVSRNGDVVQGLEFLDRARCADVRLSDRSVVVVGGGNTAMDAARSALRLGAKDVRVIYRRTRAEMPAIGEEVEEAIEEGVTLLELVAPLQLRHGDHGLHLVCRRMTLGELDESGRRRPVPLHGEGALVDLRCDTVLVAVGQSADVSVLPDDAEVRDCRIVAGWGPALVFAAGDFATGEGTVAAAIGSGRAAAERILAALSGSVLEPCDAPALAGPDVVALDRFPKMPQHKCSVLPATKRRSNFEEVRGGLVRRGADDAASGEAARCLSCGACNACETCVAYCPEGVLHCAEAHACAFDYDYCKGCGLCAALCPRGAIVMESANEAVSI